MLRRKKRIAEADLLWAQINEQVAPLFDYWLDMMRVPGSFSDPGPFAGRRVVISGNEGPSDSSPYLHARRGGLDTSVARA
jgi:hypothetical protein